MFSPVRENENKYRFITKVDCSNMSAENIYFAKSVADRGEVPAFGAKINLSEWRIVEIVNSKGESRMKLTNNLIDIEEAVKRNVKEKGYTLA